jgi:DNA replication protein DnaC/primosomal protein DnaI
MIENELTPKEMLEQLMMNGKNNGTRSEYEPQGTEHLCEGCRGLDECRQYMEKGYYTVFEFDEFYGYKKENTYICNYLNQKRIQDEINKVISNARVPKRYAKCRLDDYEITTSNKKAVKVAKEIIKNNGSAIFYGGRGCGKTMLVSIIINELAKKQKGILFKSVPELLNAIRAKFKDGTADEVLETIKKVDVLVLDDLGTEKMTRWVSEQLFLIVNHRYDNELPIIITTNYTPRELAKRLVVVDNGETDKAPAERIMSRLYEMCEIVEIGGNDRRMNK